MIIFPKARSYFICPLSIILNSISCCRSGDEAQKYKEKVISRHDIFLESLLPTGSYTKLYSYTHLLSGFALHTASEEVLLREIFYKLT